MSDIAGLKFKKGPDGLFCAVVQDASDGRVLMVAWMNEKAFELSRDTGIAHFWSRSRSKLWKKGESSGNMLKIRSIQVDCDADCVLLSVDASGPACHEGYRSCFFRTVSDEKLLVTEQRVMNPDDMYGKGK